MADTLYLTKEEMVRILQEQDGDPDISPRTVIHYRQVGLLDDLDDEQGRGRYTAHHLAQLRAARALRRAGKSIDEVRRIIHRLTDQDLLDLRSRILDTIFLVDQGMPASAAPPNQSPAPHQSPIAVGDGAAGDTGGRAGDRAHESADGRVSRVNMVRESSAPFDPALAPAPPPEPPMASLREPAPAPLREPQPPPPATPVEGWRVVPAGPGVWLLMAPDITPGQERRLRRIVRSEMEQWHDAPRSGKER